MNGNITKEGIALDLEWMYRVGLRGFSNFDAALGTPKVVYKRLFYMTLELKDAFLFATHKADELGLEMAIAGSPGWSKSGGPWVKPNQVVKKIVWSETSVEGSKLFQGVLPAPPTETGPFGDLVKEDLMGSMSGGDNEPPPIDFGATSAVIAFPDPAIETPMAELKPKITVSDRSQMDDALLWDGDLNDAIQFRAAVPGEKLDSV